MSNVVNGEADVRLPAEDTTARIERLERENRQLRASIRGAQAALATFDPAAVE